MLPDDDRTVRLRKGWASRWRFGLIATLAIASVAVVISGRDRLVSAGDDIDAIADETVVEVPVERALIARVHELPEATVYVVLVPKDRAVSVAVADGLKTVRDFVKDLRVSGTQPLAVVNGGFFDPNNGKTTSHLIVNTQRVGNPAENEGLTGNPKMQPYLPQIFNRSEFRVYDCPLVAMLTPYAITAHDDPAPEGCNVVHAIGAGPQLLPADTSETEAFTRYENGELVRDAIGSVYPNARSAIGIHQDGSAMLIMVAQRPDAPGFTLAEVAEFAASEGATQLLNLDGGSSASLFYGTDVVLGRLNSVGEAIERPVKSVIVVE